MSDNYKKFPTLDEVKSSIARLKQASWPNWSDLKNPDDFLKEVEKIIFSEFEIIPNIQQIFTQRQFPLPIFRVRELSSFTDINLLAEHSYPPINLTGFGRCNFPKSPVFYSSNNPITALLEVIRNSDYKHRKFCLSKWSLIESDEQFMFQTFLHTELHEDNVFKKIKLHEQNQLPEVFEKMEEDKISALTEYLNFLHSSFIQDEQYALSASLAHRILKAPHNYATDILMYPSIQTQSKGINMAIHPNFVDRAMKIDRFYILQLEEYDGNTDRCRFTISKYGDIEKNIVIWKNLNPNDQKLKSHIESDFGNYLIEEINEWKIKDSEED